MKLRIDNSKIYGNIYIPVDSKDVMRDNRLYPYKNFGLYASTIDYGGLNDWYDDIIEVKYVQSDEMVFDNGIKRSVEFYISGSFRDVIEDDLVLLNSQYEYSLNYISLIGYNENIVDAGINVDKFWIGCNVYDGLNKYTVTDIIGQDLYLNSNYLGNGNLGNIDGDDYTTIPHQNGVFKFFNGNLIYIGATTVVYIYLGENQNTVYFLNKDINGEYLTGLNVLYRIGNPALLKCDFEYSLSEFSDLIISCPSVLSVAHPTHSMPYSVEEDCFKLLNLTGQFYYNYRYNDVIVTNGNFGISGMYLSNYGMDKYSVVPSYNYRATGVITLNGTIQNISNYTRVNLNVSTFSVGDIVLIDNKFECCIISIGINYIDVLKQIDQNYIDSVITVAVENLNTFDNNIESELNVLNKTVGRIYDLSEDNGMIKIGGVLNEYVRYDCSCIINGNNFAKQNYMLEDNIFDYLTNYLTLPNNLEITKLSSMVLLYNNITGDSTRVGVEGSNKLVGQGTVIILGNSFNPLNHLKPGIFVSLKIDGTDYPDIWIDDIVYDEEWYIYTNNYFPTPTNTIEINPYTSIQDILTKLDTYYNISNFKWSENINLKSYASLFLDEMNTGFYNIYDEISTVLFNDDKGMGIYLTKLDKNSQYDIDRQNISCATTTNIDLNTTTIIDSYNLQINDYIIVKNQTISDENGLYIYNGGLVKDNVKTFTYYKILNGVINTGKYFVYHNNNFMEVNNRTVIDNRLSLKFREIAELTVDRKRHEFKPIGRADILINGLYDIQIGEGINPINNIRFIDGLTEEKIKNAIDGQEQYAWILNEENIIENAVVGCTQINGPGTGDLIWYSGTWINGTWCNGIWISGTWENGIWLNGQFYSKNINDFTSYILYSSSNNLVSSIWKNGIFINGEMYGGTVDNITWMNGIHYDGVIHDGIWKMGDFYNGVINHIFWENGHFYNGDFETGVWINGIFDGGRFGINSLSTTDYKDRAIWVNGEFNAGGFYSTDNKSSVFYNGVFKGDFYGGSFIFGEVDNGTFYNGVYFGGIYTTIQIIDNNSFKLNIDYHIYDDILGLDVLNGYMTFNNIYINMNDKLHLKADTMVQNGTTNQFFINEWYTNHTTNYQTLTINNIDNVNNEILITGNNINLLNISYYQSDPNTNTPNGNPFLMYKFVGDFNGIWLNGYFELGNFSGAWVNGFAKTIVYN